jgi:hypothetical protein
MRVELLWSTHILNALSPNIITLGVKISIDKLGSMESHKYSVSSGMDQAGSTVTHWSIMYLLPIDSNKRALFLGLLIHFVKQSSTVLLKGCKLNISKHSFVRKFGLGKDGVCISVSCVCIYDLFVCIALLFVQGNLFYHWAILPHSLFMLFCYWFWEETDVFLKSS